MKHLAYRAMAAGALLALALSAAAPAAQAEGFTGADLLAWEPESQAFYFRTSVTMAGVIASQNNREQARCVDRWHEEQNARGFEALLSAMRTHSTYHPQAVVLWLLQHECGSFRFTEP